jgi:hypothetical protein
VPCGGPTQKPEPRSKRYGPKWQRTAILGVFFFPAGPVPLYILQDGPASLGARKVLRPICGRSGIFPATTGPDKKKKKKKKKKKNQRWWCVSQRQPATTNARTTSNQTSTLTSTSLWRIRPGARDPPPAPCMSAWAFACHMTWLTAPVLLNGGSVCLGVCHAGACAHTHEWAFITSPWRVVGVGACVCGRVGRACRVCARGRFAAPGRLCVHVFV